VIACAAPDGELGVAIRLSTWLDCQARALGENGFQAFTGGPVATGLLSGLVTIFVALIGYRMLLGTTPTFRDGVGWAVRLGVVLALVTGWPAFQTLVYRVAVDAPGELAAVVMPAAGLPNEALDGRIQLAYDTIRLGSTRTVSERIDRSTPVAEPLQAPSTAAPLLAIRPGVTAQPQIASVFVLATTGVIAAARLAAGFLLAVAPLAILAMLFDATLGLFNGWVRALAGAALAQLAAVAVSAVGLIAVESELAHLQAAEIGGAPAASVDPQALLVIVLFTAAAMIAGLLAASRMASAIRLGPLAGSVVMEGERHGRGLPVAAASGAASIARMDRTVQANAERSRANAVADALAATIHREQSGSGRPTANAGDAATAGAPRRMTIRNTPAEAPAASTSPMLGVAGRRGAPRATRSAGARDRRR